MKKFFAVSLSIGIVTFTGCMQEKPQDITVIGNIYLPKGMQTIKEFTSVSTVQNTEFAWDIHHVLVAKNVPGMLKTGWNYKLPLLSTIGSLLKESLYYPFTRKTGETHRLVAHIWSLLRQHATGEAYKIALNSYNNKLGTMVTELVNQQDPICGMQELLEDVKKQGYKQRVASNIGEGVYPLLAAKYSEFFSYFDDGTTVQYNQQDTIKKPDIRFFEFHKNKYLKEPIRYFIFIDDQQKNLVAAAQAGMLAILAHTSFVEQLRNDLRTIKALP